MDASERGMADDNKANNKVVSFEGPEAKLSTLSTLWKVAIQKFSKENHVSISELELEGDFPSTGSGVEKANLMWQKARHSDDRKDKIVTAVGGCLGWIDMAVEYLKDAVPDGYGTPAKIVAGTISYMIKAANKMTSDFDLIETTFEGLNNALRDIGLLKNHSTREDHFTYRLMEIFLAMFDFCSYTTTPFRKHTRRNMYLRALFKGNNEKIQQKCDHVKKAIQQFRDTVPVKSYATVLETNEKIDELPNNLIVAIQSMKSSDLQLLLGRQKPTFKDILENFRKRGVNVDAKATMEKQMELIKIRSVADTFSWIREAPTYSSWLKGQPSPFLYVSGSSGAGKTYFMYKCCRILEDGPKATSIATQSDKVKQIASVACFFFEPGKEDAQSFRNILATLVLQIAEQDVRLCETMAKDLEKVSKDDEAGMVTTLWETMILKKFERTSEASPRTLYILLDGIDQMKDEYFSDMMDRFKALGPDKHSIRVMLSGSRDMGNKVDLKSLSKIDLDEMTKSKGDIAKVINDRIHKSAALNNLGLHFKEKITDKFNHWASSVMSSVDLMLSLIEQNGGDRYAAAKLIEEAETPEWLYRAMIRLVKVNRSDLVRKSVETLYSWCTYAKQPLSVDELQHIWSIDTNLGKFDIREEIQGKSFSLLCIETLLPGQYDAASSLTNHDVVSFRQPAIRDFIEAEGNDMIEDPLQEKVNIFKTLCAILSSGSADGDPLRKRLQSYACRELIRHLDDIDVKATSSEQGRDVVEGIVRVLCNENDVCSVFETAFRDSYRFSVDFDLYESSGLGIFNMAGKLTAWAKKMNFHDEEDLSLDATDWVEASIIMPQRMLETLGCGHLENWVKAVTVSEATVPYMLAYRCLYIVGIFEDPALKRHMDLPVLSPDEVMTEYIAKIMLRYARKVRHFPRVKFAKARIATALLLSEGNDEDHDKALQFYTANIVDKSTPGPEKFYSLLGIAEYYDRKARGVTDDEAKETWIKVQEYTSKALQQLAQEKGALGSELDNGRCLAALLLKANASMRLADDAKALDTCEGLLQAFDLGQVQWGFQLLHALTMVVEIHYRHGRYARLVHQVLNQKTPLKCAWFCDRTAIMNHSVYAVDAFREAAVRSRRVDMSIRLCEEAIEYWRQNDSTMAIFLQDNLAVIYGQDARTTVMAERVLDNIIETIQKDYTLLKGGILRSVFPRMVDILSEKCHLSQSEVTKRESVMKLTGLINEFKGTAVVEPITFAVALIALARMQKDCPGYGVARAMVEADRAFKLCIADLEDSTGANDGLAFCALARVLMFAGYDVDASVCLSLQFSEVRDYDDSESRSQTPDSALKRWNTNSSRGTGSTKSDEESGQDDDTSSTVSTTQDGGVDNHDTPNVIPEEPASNSRPLLLGPPEVEPVVNNEDQIAATSDETDAIEETRLTNGTIQIIDEAPANASTIKESQHANGTHVEGDVRLTNGARMTADGEGAPNPVDSVQDAQPVSSSAASVVMAEALDTVSKSRAEKTMSSGRDIAQEEEVSDKMRDVESDTHKEEEVPNPREGEDVFEYGKLVYCDGRCSLNPITAWPLTEKYYFCNDCVDVAFCGKCYPTQTQYYEDYGQGFWYKVCWAKHEFLEAPIDGWRGVRNGMIRIGDKEKSWFEWLDEVKKKWQKKMNEFGEGGLNSNERIGT